MREENPSDEERTAYQLFAVSDGTGGTAQRVIEAALMQFDRGVEVQRFSEVRTVQQIREIVRHADSRRALIVHTLVSDDLRQAMFDECRRHHVHTLDLMGPLLERLSDVLGASPSARPGLYVAEEYNRRIDAVDYAVRHDDGRRVHEIDRADIVLVGVSRTGKTPLSIYLAYRGWMVANVPIVPGIEPPEALLRLPPERVIGLTIDPKRLAVLRQQRVSRFGGALGDYADPRQVQKEVTRAQWTFAARGWREIDMTAKPIEEAAAEIVTLLGGP
jgi:regulator of PEP synthase PpsR (kinase-PPPase family)